MNKVNGVIMHKLETLDKVLLELKPLSGSLTIAQLDADMLRRRGVERCLQVLVEIVVDICQRLIAINGQSPASTGVDAIERCVQIGMLKSSEPYAKMVQFRNFVVHRYEYVDTSILVNIVNNHLYHLQKGFL